MILSLVISIVFTGLGFWFVLAPPQSDHLLFGNTPLLLLTGLSAVVLFGLLTVSISIKLFDKKPGLIIDDQEITDNSSGLSADFIPWEEIEEIQITRLMSQKLLVIVVKNPQIYIDRVSNPVKRSSIKMNFSTYGSPLVISSNALKVNFANLHTLIVEKFDNKKSEKVRD